MAHVPVETNFWDSPEAVRLGEILGDRDAWRHVVRLWAWALGADIESGVLCFPAWKIAESARFIGDAELFVNGLKSSGLLVERRGGLYMAGWSRMRKFFQEKKRLRDYRRRKKDDDAYSTRTRTRTRTRTSDVLGNPYLSPSPYLIDIGARELKLHEVEQLGFQKCHQLGGSAAAAIKSLMPIFEHELSDALKTEGTSWKYIARVIESQRLESSKPKPPYQAKPAEAPSRGWNSLEPEEPKP